MAAPLASAKQSVSLTSSRLDGSNIVRGSRIRRDPPPVVKEVTVAERDERDTRTVLVGVLTFTLALLFIGIAVSGWLGWSPREYVAHL